MATRLTSKTVAQSKKKQLALLFPDVLIKDYVVSACNRNADRLRKMGQSDAKIFSESHQIPATTSPAWKLDFTVGGDTTSETFTPIPADSRRSRSRSCGRPTSQEAVRRAGRLQVAAR